MTSMNKTLYINDIALSDYGIYCSSDTYLNAPSIDYSEYQIPARTGTLIQYNKRLNNVLRVFSCICRKETYYDSLAELKRLLYKNTGYVKLASDYEENLYQYGYFTDDLNIDCVEHEDVVMFELTFSCNPKKYKETEIVSIARLSHYIYTKRDSIIQLLLEKYNGLVSGISENTKFIRLLLGQVIDEETISFGRTMIERYDDEKNPYTVYDENLPIFLCVQNSINTLHDWQYVSSRNTEYTIREIDEGGTYAFAYIPIDLINLRRLDQYYTENQSSETRSGISLIDSYFFISNEASFETKMKIAFKLGTSSAYDNPMIAINGNLNAFILTRKVMTDSEYLTLLRNFEDEDGNLYLYIDFKNNEAYISTENESEKRLSFNDYINIEGNQSIYEKINSVHFFYPSGTAIFFRVQYIDAYINRWTL